MGRSLAGTGWRPSPPAGRRGVAHVPPAPAEERGSDVDGGDVLPLEEVEQCGKFPCAWKYGKSIAVLKRRGVST